MKNFIENLRKKPEAVRRRIAFVTTGALSVLVFSVWFSVWGTDSAQEGRVQARAVGKEISPLDALGNIWGAGKDAVAASFVELEHAASSSQVQEDAKRADGVVYPEEVFGKRDFATTSEQ